MTLEIIAKLATAFTLSILLGAIATFAEERELRDALPLPPDPVIKPAGKPSFTNSGKRSGI